jgi:ABC-type transporter Mla subunit MlaD
MNASRRSRIASIEQQLSVLIDEIDGLAADEQSAFDNLPESFQFSEKGDNISAAVDALQEVSDDLQQSKSRLEEIRA